MLRTSWLLTLITLATLSSAFNLAEIHIDGVEAYLHKGQKRQASGTGNTSPAAPTSSPAPVTSSPRPPQSTPQASTPPPNSPTPNSPTSAPPASTPAPGSSRQNTPTQRSSANNPQTSAAPETSIRTTAIVRTSPLVSTSEQIFTTIITTQSNGQQIEVTSTGTSSVPITTGQAQITDLPTSQSNDGSNGSGLSETNKKVIGGVVGGIGGALLLGGIALVFWRMRKRQHKVTADDDDLNLNTGAALGDKPHNGTGASPFQSNLEQYHNPGGRPNAAANF